MAGMEMQGTETDGPAAWRRQAWLMAAMALLVVVAFAFQFAMGRSSLSAPPVVHVHGLIFMGWLALSVAQGVTAATGKLALHRRLGWLGAAWVVVMVPAGVAVTAGAVREGRTPFFFQPQLFLFEDVATLLAFAGLAGAAIALRRDTGWHRRLHLCALACLMGPAFGRLLPMPLMMPVAMEVAMLPGLLFPAWLAWREWREDGRLHPAWPVGLAVPPLVVAAALLLAHGPLGGALYEAAVAGGPGAAVPGLGFPPPPGCGGRWTERPPAVRGDTPLPAGGKKSPRCAPRQAARPRCRSRKWARRETLSILPEPSLGRGSSLSQSRAGTLKAARSRVTNSTRASDSSRSPGFR
jgi:hypothetical protein